MPRESPSQTAGPYVHIGLTPNYAEVTGVYDRDLGDQMVTEDTQGQRIRITGTVYDGANDPVRDALIEVWQPGANGRFAGDPKADPHFTGFGRCAADLETGAFSFETIMPGATKGSAPFITVWIVARGINLGLHTRIYFAHQPQNVRDPVLSQLDEDRRASIIAIPTDEGYHFDVHLQGPGETVFFDV